MGFPHIVFGRIYCANRYPTFGPVRCALAVAGEAPPTRYVVRSLYVHIPIFVDAIQAYRG